VALATGVRLGPYEILAPLGKGGMGEVYCAKDTRLGRDVAIKVIAGIADEHARAHLLHEARLAAALNDPHICTIHEISDADSVLFIVMEHVKGRPLSDLVADGVPPTTVVRLGIQIADALAHAHECGVVHRDLKSANVMMATDGRVKVLDFGLARGFDAARTHSPATRAGNSPDLIAAAS
jgi:serine/threonine protein kinase